MIETNLTYKDVAIVAVNGALSTWSGETVHLVILSNNKIPFSGPFDGKIYIVEDGEDYYKLAQEMNGNFCISFKTKKVREVLEMRTKEQSADSSADNSSL